MNYPACELNLLEVFLENTADLYWVFDSEKLVKKSNNFYEFFENDEYCSEIDLFKNIIVTEDTDALELWSEKIRNKQVFNSNAVISFPRRAGQWYAIVSIPVEEDGVRVGYLKDISEQRKKDDELYHIVNRYENFVSRSSYGIFRMEMENPVDCSLPAAEQAELINDNAYLAECNSVFARFSGVNDIYKIIGKKLVEFEDFDSMYQEYGKGFIEANYRLKNLIIEKKYKEGEQAYFNAHLSGDIENGKLVRIWGIISDVSEALKAQQEFYISRYGEQGEVDQHTKEIKEKFNFLITLIESLPFPVYVLSEGEKYTIVNKSFEDFTSLNKADILGRSAKDVGPSFLSDKEDAKSKKIIHRDSTDIYEVEIHSSGVLPRNALIYQTEVKFDGNSEYVLGVINDITERKNLEIQTKNALQKERELNQVKTNFISMVSHEFRTPLTAILTTAEFIERYYERINKEKLNSQIKNIYFSVEKMTALLEDIIFLSRKERGKLELNPEEISLGELAEKTVNDVSGLLDGSQSIEIDNKLTGDVYLLDKKLLYIIISNLLTNAIKYSPKDKSIYFSLENTDDKIKLLIKDEGIGIKPSDHDKIFEPFYRTSEVSSIPGSGLGLSVVKEAVDAHNGIIDFESVLQHGTKFEVTIPLK